MLVNKLTVLASVDGRVIVVVGGQHVEWIPPVHHWKNCTKY